MIVATNQATPKPLTLDYEMTDPNDRKVSTPASGSLPVHASKGIPIFAFFTTGLIRTSPALPIPVDKEFIFPKMARIAAACLRISGFSTGETRIVC